MTFEQPVETRTVQDPHVDAVQREVMTAISPDGRPPDLATARRGWRRAVIAGLVIAVVGIVVLIVTLGPTAGALASILLVGYIALTVPVWGAGILRGQEERVAHNIAEQVVHPDHHSHST